MSDFGPDHYREVSTSLQMANLAIASIPRRLMAEYVEYINYLHTGQHGEHSLTPEEHRLLDEIKPTNGDPVCLTLITSALMVKYMNDHQEALMKLVEEGPAADGDVQHALELHQTEKLAGSPPADVSRN